MSNDNSKNYKKDGHTKVGCTKCNFTGYKTEYGDFGLPLGETPCKCNPNGKYKVDPRTYRSW